MKSVIVYGGTGALGKSMVDHFKAKGIDVISVGPRANDSALHNVIITEKDDWCNQEKEVLSKVKEVLNGEKVDGIYCVAGGWAGGNAASVDYIKNCDLTWKQSVWSSTIAASVATKHLKENGMLVLTGATPALGGTSFMTGYGLAKAAVHQLCKSLSQPKSGLPKGSCVFCILPTTLDTPNNRKFMPKADFTTWTKLEFISDLCYKWTCSEDHPHKSGSLIELKTLKSQTTLVINGQQ